MNWRIASAVLLLLLISSSVLFAKQPSILVFEATKGQGADNVMTASATKAIIKYFWETKRVEAAIFNRQSPTVLRAIMDKQLTSDKVASYSSRTERIEVGKVLSYDYVAGLEIEQIEGKIVIKLWMSDLNNKKNLSWESRGVARAGGTGLFDQNNAIESAASAVVIDIASKAFVKLSVKLDNENTHINNDADVTSRMPSASTDDNLSKADQYILSGSIALAIQYYQQAINVNPSDPSIRLKLALAYASKNMNKESEIEIENARAMGATQESIAEVKQNILKLADKPVPVIETVTDEDEKTEAIEKTPNIAPESNVNTTQSLYNSKISEGDKLWEQGKTQAATEIYKEVIKSNPSDWRPYERLAVLLASQSLFNDSRMVLAKLDIIQPDLTDELLFNRYQMITRAFDTRLIYLSNSYDSDFKDFSKKKFSRESYYNSIKILVIQLDSMTKFADIMPAPKQFSSINLKRYLACGLLAQAATNMLNYLETNKTQSKNNSDTFSEQAKNEIKDIVSSYSMAR